MKEAFKPPYTRAEAIENGILLDFTRTAKKAGFNLPTAFTHEALEAITENNEPGNAGEKVERSLLMLHAMVSLKRPRQPVFYFPFTEDCILKAMLHDGDNKELVLTISLKD